MPAGVLSRSAKEMNLLSSASLILLWLIVLAFTFIDPYNRYAFETGLTIILFSVAVALAAQFKFRSSLRSYLVLFMCALFSLFLWNMTRPDGEDLERIAQPAIDSMGRFYDTHQQFPQSLNSIEQPPRKTRFGDWIYEVDEEGGSFTLTVGDYGRDLFTGTYYSSSKLWSWDS